MGESTSHPDKLEKDRFVLEQARIRLDAQLQLAIAADQRAMTLTGIFTAIATALFGVGIAGGLSAGATAGATMAGLFMVAGSVACIASAWPRKFTPAGNLPANWWEYDGFETMSLADVFRRESENYHDYITENRRTMRCNGGLLRIGAILGAAGPLVGLIVAAAWGSA